MKATIAAMFLKALVICCSLVLSSQSQHSLKEVALDINSFYDTQHPPQFHMNPLLSVHHSKRCTSIENNESILKFMSGTWKSTSKDFQILVSTPCLGTDSLGNGLGAYFENIVCANKSGMHYVSVANIWEPKDRDVPSPCLSQIPTVIENLQPLDEATVKSNLKQLCKCQGSCHERPNAVWTKGLNIIKPIIDNALQHYLKTVPMLNHTVVLSTDLSNVPTDTKLPLIPEAAIHYRCGDNFVGHYGFLPFSAFVDNIPSSVKTIYVLAENRDRKTKIRRHLATKCDAIFQSLLTYLTHRFPSSTVLIRRGDDLYLDMARLAYAQHVVCSVSTFCLWPAIVNANKAYFPRTKLIVGGNTDINLGFKWITSPEVLRGQNYEHVAPAQLVAKLIHGG